MKITTPKLSFLFLFLFPAILFSGCSKDDEHHQPTHEQEVITTLNLYLMMENDSSVVAQISFKDPDGEGGQNGIVIPDTLRLAAGSFYSGRVEVLDESDPANVHDLTDEIEEEGTEHQFFFIRNTSGLDFSVVDHDANNLPLGLRFRVNTSGEQTKGSFRVLLSHFTDTPKTGNSSSGETDIEVVFPVSIEQ